MSELPPGVIYRARDLYLFVTSRFYTDERRPWVTEFNKAGMPVVDEDKAYDDVVRKPAGVRCYGSAQVLLRRKLREVQD